MKKQNIAQITTFIIALFLPRISTGQVQFTYFPTGDLIPGSGSYFDQHFSDLSHLRFPLKNGPVYANSQLYNPGGSWEKDSLHPRMNHYPGPYYFTGLQQSAPNYSYSWRDNYCEFRGYATPYCFGGTGHQGQDIRPATPANDTHEVVAMEGGDVVIVNHSTSEVWINISGPSNPAKVIRRYIYRHMSSISVNVGNSVAAGSVIGKVSNVFGGTLTTVHLHLEMFALNAQNTLALLPPYPFLVKAYERLIGQTGVQVYQNGDTVYAGKNLSVYALPAPPGAQLGAIGAGTKGVILDGPRQAGTITWFKVSWNNGQIIGWVEDFLHHPRFIHNDRTKVSGSSSYPMAAPVYSVIGGTPIANMATGNQGTIRYDPVVNFTVFTETLSNGTTINRLRVHLWRNVLWDNGTEGWTEEYYLQNIPNACSPTSNTLGGLIQTTSTAGGCGPPQSSPTPTVASPPTGTIPVATATRTQARTPTLAHTNTPPPLPSWTPTPSVIPTSTPTPGTLVFIDYFNRPDSEDVGNGWIDNNSHISIANQKLEGSGMVAHPLPFQFPIRLRVKMEEGGCHLEGDNSNRFDHYALINANSAGSGGCGLSVFRAGSTVNNSHLTRINGGSHQEKIYSNVSFIGTIELDYVIQGDGSMSGVVKTTNETFDFSFPPQALLCTGNHLALGTQTYCPDNPLSLDEVIVEAQLPENPIPTNTATPADTPTPFSTSTWTATSTHTETPTATASATNTKTLLPTIPSPANATPTRKQTAVSTATRTPTVVPSATFTKTPLPTASHTRTWTLAPTNTPSPSPTPTPIPDTATPTATEWIIWETDTPTPTPLISWPTPPLSPTPWFTWTPWPTKTPRPTRTPRGSRFPRSFR